MPKANYYIYMFAMHVIKKAITSYVTGNDAWSGMLNPQMSVSSKLNEKPFSVIVKWTLKLKII